MFYDDKLCKTTEAYCLEPGRYSSIIDIVEAINTLIQKRNKHRDTCITIKDLGQKIGGDLKNDLGIPCVRKVRMN